MAISPSTLAAIRFGYGLRPGQTPPADAEALLAQLPKALAIKPRFPREGIPGRRDAATRIMSLRAAEAKAAQDGKPNESIRKQAQQESRRMYRQDAMGRLAQAIHSPYGFYERLASFWVDHFSTSTEKSLAMRMVVPLYEAEAIRPNLAGPFASLLKAAVLHPAMLTYLDQNQSVGPDSVAGKKTGRGLNENLGRELLELHTLGAGSGYTQDDVHAAALILTGLSVDTRGLQVVYRSRLAEEGPVTLLGRDYEDDADDGQDHVQMLDDLAGNPKTAQHICRKLAAHFIADDPPQDVVTAMTTAWSANGGDLTQVYRAMLTHPQAWDGPGAKIKQPFDYVVSGIRALGLPEKDFAALAADMDDDDAETETPVVKAMQMAGGEQARQAAKRKAGQARALTLGALQHMGQPVWQPPSPAGFADTADAWLNAGELTQRIAWARMVARTFGQSMDPSDFLRSALGDAAHPQTAEIIAQAPSRLHGLTMVLASAEFNRR